MKREGALLKGRACHAFIELPLATPCYRESTHFTFHVKVSKGVHSTAPHSPAKIYWILSWNLLTSVVYALGGWCQVETTQSYGGPVLIFSLCLLSAVTSV